MIGINEDDDNLLNSKRKEKKMHGKNLFYLYICEEMRIPCIHFLNKSYLNDIINNLNSVEYWKDDVLMT